MEQTKEPNPNPAFVQLPDNNTDDQKIAANPNPRANENIQQTSIETTTTETDSTVGSEITDGEGG